MLVKTGKYFIITYIALILCGILLVLFAISGLFMSVNDSSDDIKKKSVVVGGEFRGSGYTRAERIGNLYHWPCPGITNVTSNWGWRTSGFHHGIDLGTPVGTPLISADDGIVTFTGFNGIYGNHVIIKLDREPRYELVYAHIKCGGFKVSKGDKVEYGQVIGLSGGNDACKGNSRGAHLHFEVRDNGKAINPNAVINNCDDKSKAKIVKPVRPDVVAITGDIVWQQDYLLKLDLRTKSGITVSELEKAFGYNQYINGNKNGMIGTAKYFVEAENKYGVNAVFLASLAILESTWGTSNYARNRNNLFGMNANTDSPDDAYNYSNKRDCVMDVAKALKTSYLTNGGVYHEGYTLPDVRIHYCPPNNRWDDEVANLMEQLWRTKK